MVRAPLTNSTNAKRKAIATTTSAEGKTISKIRYDLDAAGRFSAGEVYDGADRLRFKTEYKYDGGGRLLEERQLTTEGKLQNRMVYSYNSAGKQTGYTVYDATGKLVGRTTPNSPKPGKTKK